MTQWLVLRPSLQVAQPRLHLLEVGTALEATGHTTGVDHEIRTWPEGDGEVPAHLREVRRHGQHLRAAL